MSNAREGHDDPTRIWTHDHWTANIQMHKSPTP